MPDADEDEVRRRLNAMAHDRERLARGGFVEPAGKSRVWYSAVPPAGGAAGDIWYNTDTMEPLVYGEEAWRRMAPKTSMRSSGFTWNPDDLRGTQEAFRRMAEEMKRLGQAVEMSEPMKAMVRGMMRPHVGSWVEGTGWVCDRCGAESFDVEILAEVPCE